MVVRLQGTLVGGVILLVLLVAFVLPIILQMTTTLSTVNEGVQMAAEVRMQSMKEKLMVIVAPEQSPYTDLGLYPGIVINNTGTIPIRIERVYILNASSGTPIDAKELCGDTPCGIIDLAHAIQNPLVANAQPTGFDCKVGILREGQLKECLDEEEGIVPLLEPGETLFIKLTDDILSYYDKIIVYVESARGVIHPIVYPPMAKMGFGAGPAIPPEAIPRGLYTPISGYILWGYEEVLNYTFVEAIHPPFRISTLGPCTSTSRQSRYIGGIPFQWYSYEIDYSEYPGTFRIRIQPASTAYIYVYTSRGWKTYRLYSSYVYEIVGFIGTMAKAIAKYNNEHVVVIDGWCYQIYRITPWGTKTPLLRDRLKPVLNYPETTSELIDEDIIYKNDADQNGIYEFGIRTVKSVGGTWDSIDADGSNVIMCDALAPYQMDVLYSDDIIAYKITVLRDITGVDAIEVAVKAIMDYWFWVSATEFHPDPNAYGIKPLIAIMLFRLDPETLTWRLVNLRMAKFETFAPYTYWIDVTFPTNKTDIYRVAIYVYDPYGVLNVDGSHYAYGWCGGDRECKYWWFDTEAMNTVDLYVDIEHIIIQYYIYNPLLKRIPVVYIVNITGAPYWLDAVDPETFGALNETMLSMYWDYLLDAFRRFGSNPIIINDWDTFRVLLGSRDAPVNPVVVFLHGPTLVFESGLTLYDPELDGYRTISTATDFVEWLANMIRDRGWVVVFPYGPPMYYAFDTARARWYGPYDTYISTMYALLTDYRVTSVTYIFRKTGGFVYPEGNLTYYMVSLSPEGLNARKVLKSWYVPRETYGNYSLVSDQSGFYIVTKPLYNTSSPPPGLDWSELGVAVGQAYGAGYVVSGRGAFVWIAACRPGVVDPRRLAEIDATFAVYVWKVVVGG